MSTEVAIQDEDQFLGAMADVRSDETNTNWALFNHVDGDPNTIQFTCSGSEGVAELQANLPEDQVMYGLVRLQERIDMSDTVKFAYIVWFPSGVSFTKRGKYGVVSGSIQRQFEPFQVSLTFDGESADSVTEEYIMTEIQSTSGTKSKVLDAAEGKTRPERGFTATTSKTSDPKSPTGPAPNIGKVGKQGSSFSGFTSQAKGGSALKVNEDFRDYIAAVRSDEDESITWVTGKFEGNNLKNPLGYLASGRDLAEMNDSFQPADIVTALIRVTDIVDDIPTVKFVYILWVGENVKPMAKGRLPTYKGDLEDLFAPYHVAIHANLLSEVRPQVINDKVGAASGSKSNVK